MRLSIVIPAYNEEAAVGDTARACLAAGPAIAAEGGIDAVEVIVVDDGSRDRTAEIVAAIPEVRLVRHDRNRGYGAAISTGFAHASGELLAFLDADGTCDPRLFGRMVRALLEHDADVVSGSRLGPGNQMPKVRRLGNRLFAWFVNLFAPQKAEDLASGMRVLRRSALARLAPLPTGLHYTPAMSAKSLFDDTLTLVETPIPYAERVGESKLSVLRDGLRFLRVLTLIALSYRPFPFFGLSGLGLLLGGLLYAIAPARVLFAGGTLPEQSIYRLVTIVVLVAAGFALVACGLLAQQATAIIHGTRRDRMSHRLGELLLIRHPYRLACLLVLAAALLNAPGLASYFRAGQVDQHWVFAILGGLLTLGAAELCAFGTLGKLLVLLAERQAARVAPAEAAPATPALDRTPVRARI